MMNRADIFRYVEDTFGILPDYPFARAPGFAILRHPTNRKWFGAVMDLPAGKLGLPGSRVVDAINLKCGPLLAGSLRGEAGILPAYHMNKEHWVTVLLESPLPNAQLCSLIDLSFDLTR